MGRKILILAGLMFAMMAELSAQNIAAFKGQLTQRSSVGEGTVTVDEYGSAMQAVDSYMISAAEKKDVNGFRVSIYSGKSQTARTEALEAQSQFQAMFPTVPTYLVYSEPYFTLSVGNCRDKEEALVLWGRVKNVFTKAFIANAVIPMEEFLKTDADYTAVEVEPAEGEVQGEVQQEMAPSGEQSADRRLYPGVRQQ